MDLSIIARLVRTRVRLILPDFGAFLVQRLEDGFSVDNVTFSAFLRYDDGSFVNALVEELGVSRLAAQQQAEMIVQELKRALETQSVCVLPHLGVLRKMPGGLVVLEPDANASAGMALDGGAAHSTAAVPVDVSVEPVTAAPEATASTDSPAAPEGAPSAVGGGQSTRPTPVAGGAAVPPAATSPKEGQSAKSARPARPVRPAPPRYVQRRPVKPSKVKASKDKSLSSAGGVKRKGIGGIAVLVVLLLVVLFVGVDALWLGLVTPRFLKGAPYLAEQPRTSAPSGSGLQGTAAVEALGRDSVQSLSDTGLSTEASTALQAEYQKRVEAAKQEAQPKTRPEGPSGSASPAQAEVQSAPASQAAQSGAYKIIVGSFSVPQNATGFAAQVRQRGYEGAVVENSQGMRMVTLGSYSTRAAAQEALVVLREEYPDAWIYR